MSTLVECCVLQAKEISEAMGAAEALSVLNKLEALQLHSKRVLVLVPVAGSPPGPANSETVAGQGDGHTPMAAAAVCLGAPSSWTVYSIDPLMDCKQEDLDAAGRLPQWRGG